MLARPPAPRATIEFVVGRVLVIGENAGRAGLVEAGVLREPSPLVRRVGAVAETELQDFVDAVRRGFSSRPAGSLKQRD